MSFDHRAHVRLAWQHIATGGLSAAWVQVPAYLRGVAAAAGQPERYHETMTLGFLLLIADRFEADETFEAFALRCPELFAEPSVLAQHWRLETLRSARARQRFVFPDAN